MMARKVPSDMGEGSINRAIVRDSRGGSCDMASIIVLYKGKEQDEEFEDKLARLLKAEFGVEKETSGPLWNERWFVKFKEDLCQ